MSKRYRVTLTTDGHHRAHAQAYAWPGGYPMYYLCEDGEVMCPQCVTENLGQCNDEDARGTGWSIVGEGINWEDPNMFCCNCGERIESAYAEDES